MSGAKKRRKSAIHLRRRSTGVAARPTAPLKPEVIPVADRPPAEVPFGPSGLRLYATYLDYLARVRAGRAASTDTQEAE